MPRPVRDAAAFITANLRIVPVPALPEIRLYLAHPGSGLSRLQAQSRNGPVPPYWAYVWAGGAALARHFLDHPEVVRGRRVLDLGSGSGIVGIAAAKAGAAQVTCAEIAPYGLAAIGMNAALNGVTVTVCGSDLTSGEPPDAGLIAVGDLFYDPGLAARVTPFLDRCCARGITVLVGDPGRAWLPLAQLHRLASYPVHDFGEGSAASPRASSIFAYGPPQR